MLQEGRNAEPGLCISALPSPGALLGPSLEGSVTLCASSSQGRESPCVLFRILKFQATAFLIPSAAGWLLRGGRSYLSLGRSWAGAPVGALLPQRRPLPTPFAPEA